MSVIQASFKGNNLKKTGNTLRVVWAMPGSQYFYMLDSSNLIRYIQSESPELELDAVEL